LTLERDILQLVPAQVALDWHDRTESLKANPASKTTAQAVAATEPVQKSRLR
jgi:hypothetical protein